MHIAPRGLSRRDALKLAGAAGLAGIVTAYPGRRAFAASAPPLDLAVERTRITIDGETSDAIAIGGSIPAPTLRWREGDEVVVRVTNRLDEPTSIHWHGLLIQGVMDGAPGFNGFQPIMPGQTYTYRFKLRQAGTYWYHSHSAAQEQEGMYGAIVIEPADRDPVRADRDYVVLLSDHTPEAPEAVLRKLKVSEGYYNDNKRTLMDFFRDAGRDGLGATLRDRLDWGEMRMDATDLADVTGYRFLVNGKGPGDNWTALFKPGERVRLRIVNGSAMTIFDVRIPGLPMTVVAADGQNVVPVKVDEFRFGVGETYDVIVMPTGDKPFTFFAEPIDRTGFARATIATRQGMEGVIPERRPRAVLTMADMGMAHGGMDHGSMPGMNHGSMAGMDHGKMPGMNHGSMTGGSAAGREQAVGWADAGTPPGARALSYADLKSFSKTRDLRAPAHEIEVRLTGMMSRYIWTLNGEKFDEGAPIRVAYGDRVRIRFVNTTMMAHPMHLHGMFVELENGQTDRMPKKHVVLVPPGQTASVQLTADEPGEWPFHCHLLYHMASGMMTRFIVEPKTASL
ncbi:copper resistance system multicopper oxidase [Azospirillum isscasi]|uniref:Copper resistance system multicopper oxidase n=1 Tax=Azospirillum isscasi TaxID=3053926 RepID=A0ABU0WD85_9PROT|nr:copper resistance system multicopper oxidase [Azospirillum isscasi]MDQ2102149.1 copper resistance system multicopper oxidase [Azospirillum isscasi]